MAGSCLQMGAHGTDNNAAVAKLLAEAGRLQGAGRLAAAESRLQEALKLAPQAADPHLGLAALAQQAGEPARAVRILHRACDAVGKKPPLFAALAVSQKALGNRAAAIEAYQTAIALGPCPAAVHINLGNLLKSDGRLNDAIAAYEQALEIEAGNATACFNMANACHDAGRRADAIRHLRRAIALRPDFAAAHAQLGIVIKLTGDRTAALGHYLRALEIDPKHLPALFNLGKALHEVDDLDEAAAAYRQALAIQPDYAEALNNLGAVLKDQRRLDEAAQRCTEALAVRPDYANAHHNLAAVRHEQGDIAGAIRSYRRAMDLDPADHTARHMYLALTGQGPRVAPTDYARTLFEAYADRFERHVTEDLGYAVPRLLAALLRRVAGPACRFSNALDMGCGTGLSGRAFRPFCDRLVGIDVAPAMIAKAGEAGVYDSLSSAEALAFLAKTDEVYELIVATDVFIYVGALEETFAAVARRLAPRGYFLFSVEKSETEDIVLRDSGRYAHADAYLDRLAVEHDFATAATEPAGIRKERGQWIPGQNYILRKA